MSVARQPVRVRWWILGFMFLFALLSFVQRTSLGVAADTIMPALHISQVQIGWLNTAFFVSYAAMQIPGGILGQVFGARRTYVAVGALGLLATVATPILSINYTGSALFGALLMAQLLLGVALAPVFPVFASVVRRWFPRDSWAVANGLQTSGMLVGGAITPIVVVSLTQALGWRMALLLAAAPVAIVTLVWGWYGRSSPREHPSVTPQELAELDPSDTEPSSPSAARILSVATNRDVLLLAFSYLCMNYAFYLLTYWSFLYLVQVRHFSGIESGLMGTLPWVGAAVGAAVGGYLSDWLGRRLGVRRGYRLLPLLTLPVAGILLLVTITVSSPYAAVAALATAFAAVEINEGAYWAATMNVARQDTGAATGVLNTGGNVAGLICQPIVAILSASGAWNLAFQTGTGFALLAAAAWLFIRSDRVMVQTGTASTPELVST
jgi:MFS transporter, ACS family, glucarate transporter